MLNFKKNIVVGVSVTPEVGLEVAQIDFATKTVLKYGCKPLAYDNNRKDIADLDIFKETLQDLLFELQIPKGSDVTLNIPSVVFKVSDYPASLNEEQVNVAIEEDLINLPVFQNSEPSISAVKLPNSNIQFNKYAYTAAQKVTLVEIAMQIREIGYNLIGIDTSVNSTLNAMMYNERINIAPDVSWVLLLVESNYCRVITMQGSCYVESFEERISIGEVLGDEENYATVANAVNPILKNVPSQCLYVVSKTNIICAKELANKLIYNAQIIHQEANIFSNEAFLETDAEISPEQAKLISLDVIGAAINRDFVQFSNAPLNLFNKALGDIYLLYQPPVLKINNYSLVLSIENMIAASVAFAILVGIIFIMIMIPINGSIKQKESNLTRLNKNISDIEKFLENNKSVSASLFDEGDEIRIGLVHNKNIYSYYTIVGTEIPQKVWLTSLSLGKNITIEGQADNLESVYSFFRNIKDYNTNSAIKLQKLGLASSSKLSSINSDDAFDTDSILTSMNADFYEFKISDAPEVKDTEKKDKTEKKVKNKKTTQTKAPKESIN
ncbi:MAG: PilN domain-containing protein [Cyanobacteria bacterium SIG31]|nr:PilN domain-containing protein [Cyanobacteria bacterium SIG31]